MARCYNRDAVDDDEKWMREAMKYALGAAEAGEVPVGAVVVKDGRVLGRSGNQVEMLHDATAHAEMLTMTQASEAMENWRLAGSTMYVTLEPCAMCAGAMVLSRVSKIVYGADDPVAGACGSTFNVVNEPKLNHRIPVVKGVLADECGALLKSFFRSRRQTSP